MLANLKKFVIEALIDGLSEVADSTIDRAVSRVGPVLLRWQSQPQTLLSGDGMVAAYVKARIKARLNDVRPELGDKAGLLYKAAERISPEDLERIADEFADSVIEKLGDRLS